MSGLLCLTAAAQAQTVLCVNASALAGGNGSCWAAPFKDLQAALEAAAASGGTINEIWVASGTYRPSKRTNMSDPRTATFQLQSGLSILGGFAGTETARSQRNADPLTNGTMLSGDIGAEGSGVDNAYHIVTGSGTDATAVLTGFRIQGGNANGADPFDRGAAMYTSAGSPTLTNCIFSSNTATAVAGAMMNDNGSNPTLTNCFFSSNSAAGAGAMLNFNGSSPTLTNCLFIANTTTGGGGAIINATNSNPTLVNCTVARNTAGGDAGGILNNDNCTLTVRNCILWANADNDGMLERSQLGNDGTLTVSFSLIQGLDTLAGNGNIDADPMFVDADGPDDQIGTPDDDLRLLPGSPAIDAGSNAVPADTADLDGDLNTWLAEEGHLTLGD